MVKRIYHLDDTDKVRILVDRLWPRGISKDKAQLTNWAKEITPSTELREGYHKGQLSSSMFQQKYEIELLNNAALPLFIEEIKTYLTIQDVTLCTAVKEFENSHIPVIVNTLHQKLNVHITEIES